MSARTYVCVPCRWARRAEAAYGLVKHLRCPSCRGALWELSKRWRIPPKRDDQGWKELAVKVERDSADWLIRRKSLGEAKIAGIDMKIASLANQKMSPRKSLAMKRLTEARVRVRATYFDQPSS